MVRLHAVPFTLGILCLLFLFVQIASAERIIEGVWLSEKSIVSGVRVPPGIPLASIKEGVYYSDQPPKQIIERSDQGSVTFLRFGDGTTARLIWQAENVAYLYPPSEKQTPGLQVRRISNQRWFSAMTKAKQEANPVSSWRPTCKSCMDVGRIMASNYWLFKKRVNRCLQTVRFEERGSSAICKPVDPNADFSSIYTNGKIPSFFENQ